MIVTTNTGASAPMTQKRWFHTTSMWAFISSTSGRLDTGVLQQFLERDLDQATQRDAPPVGLLAGLGSRFGVNPGCEGVVCRHVCILTDEISSVNPFCRPSPPASRIPIRPRSAPPQGRRLGPDVLLRALRAALRSCGSRSFLCCGPRP